MAKVYSHTQVGYQMLVLLAAGIFFVTFWMVFEGFHWIAFVVLVVLDVTLLVFSTMTVAITDSTLDITFGPGLIHKRVDLQDISECFVVTNPFWYGLGIHLTPHGWLYNVSGNRAVELSLRNGKRYRIGTDEPQELLAAIQRVIGFPPVPQNLAQPHAP
jgi:hypothetical protein